MIAHAPGYLLALIVVVVLYFPMSWMVAGVSGWRRLAASYRNDGPFHPGYWMVCRARFRAALPFDSKLKLRVGSDHQCLYLRTWPFNAPGFPELRVPWPEVSVVDGRSGFWKQCEVTFRGDPCVVIYLSSSTMENAVIQAGGQWNDGQPELPA